MGFLKELGKVRLADVLLFLQDFGFHYAVTLPFFFFFPSFVLRSSRYVLVTLARQQRCAQLPAGGKMFSLLHWHYPNSFFHRACFGHTLAVVRFASVLFQRLGELDGFAGPSTGETPGGERELKNKQINK